MWNNTYWVRTYWLKECLLMEKMLKTYTESTFSIEQILILSSKNRGKLEKRYKLIGLYVLDLYCMNELGVPAFGLDIKDLNKKALGLIKNIDQSIKLMEELIESPLYGSIEGHRQLDYLIRWNETHLLVFQAMWERYGLQRKHSLWRTGASLEECRYYYLRTMDLLNRGGDKISVGKETNTLLPCKVNKGIVNLLLGN